MYFDIKQEIDRELDKIEEILDFTKGNGLVIAVDTNSRSTAWQDSQTNKREKNTGRVYYKQKPPNHE
jgi:hypothetical protein